MELSSVINRHFHIDKSYGEPHSAVSMRYCVELLCHCSHCFSLLEMSSTTPSTQCGIMLEWLKAWALGSGNYGFKFQLCLANFLIPMNLNPFTCQVEIIILTSWWLIITSGSAHKEVISVPGRGQMLSEWKSSLDISVFLFLLPIFPPPTSPWHRSLSHLVIAIPCTWVTALYSKISNIFSLQDFPSENVPSLLLKPWVLVHQYLRGRGGRRGDRCNKGRLSKIVAAVV